MLPGTDKTSKPAALAMVICDMVLRDESTHNVSLVGLFNAITTPRLPAIHNRMHVFVSLTGMHGKHDFVLQCKAPDEGIVFEVKGEVAMEDPLAVADLNLQLRGIVFQVAGNYVFELYCGGDLLIMRRFSVIVGESPCKKQ